MESSDQVPDSAKTVQSASISTPDQGWLFAPVVPQDPLQASNADESIVIRPHSNREQDSTTAEMSAMAKGVTKEESTDQQDEILLPNLSALSLSSGTFSFMEHPEARVTMPNWRAEAIASQTSTFTDLPTLNLLVQFGSQRGFLGDNDSPQFAPRLLLLGQLLLNRAIIQDAVSDINRAIECLTRAAQASQAECVTWIQISYELVNAYRMRFQRCGRIGDISSAIDYQRQIIACDGDNEKTRAHLIAGLGGLLSLRYGVSGELDDIHGAIKYATLALALTPDTNNNRTSVLNNLGIAYMRRFERLGDLEDISKAIDCQTKVIQLTPEGHSQMPNHLNNLSASYLCRFGRLGELEDISKAIGGQTRAIQLTPEGHSGMHGQFNNLGVSYRRRFEQLGQLEDVNKAIECQSRAVQLTPEGHPDVSTQLKNLGISYSTRFERVGELEDIRRAIDCYNRAIQLIPEGHPDMFGQIGNLGFSYLRLFERLGQLEDISKAIDCQTRAIQLTPEGHPDMPLQFTNLGVSYRRRFERLGELEDVNKAIDYQTRAAQLTPKGQPKIHIIFNSLGGSYLCRFERLGELEDISKAIDCQSRAVELTPEGHPTMANRFNSLCVSYLRRFKRLGELEDLSKAIDCQTRAIELAPEGHSDLPGRLTNLGNSYRSRFERLGEPEDIEGAIEAYARALHLLAETHTLIPMIQHALGASYRVRLIHFKEPQDMLKALGCFETAACFPNGSPGDRFTASRAWAILLSSGNHSDSLPAHRITMQLLPEIVWLGMTSARRYERIAEIGAVAIEAAAAAISSKEYDLALEWLEEGRSVVWNQILQLRTPFDELATVDSVLAQNLRQVTKQLEIANRRISDATPMGVDTLSSEQDTLQHHSLVIQYSRLIAEARGLPDFHGFMRPNTAAELIPAARSGPIVVVNVHAERCDALILSPESGQTAHVPLPNLSEDRIAQLHGLMRNALAQSGIRERKFLKPFDQPRGRFEDILIALWYRLVKPILGFLKYTVKLPVDRLPRITWCTTGTLSFLPIHAAGDYGSGQDRIFDYAITSYTPTLSALLVTTPQSSIQTSGVLAVSQESTLGLSSLPGTKDELVRIKTHLRGLSYEQLENSQATPEAVLDAMEKYECVHLACHASQNAAAPTQSCFHLHNGTLSLANITQRSLKSKRLAFLSACQTATGDQKLPDEAIHLAAGMQVAGYPSVIATMWSISDCDAPSVADEVYGQLVHDGKLDCSQVARVLHVAVGALRAKVGEDAFSRWVPYIHMGI